MAHLKIFSVFLVAFIYACVLHEAHAAFMGFNDLFNYYGENENNFNNNNDYFDDFLNDNNDDDDFNIYKVLDDDNRIDTYLDDLWTNDDEKVNMKNPYDHRTNNNNDLSKPVVVDTNMDDDMVNIMTTLLSVAFETYDDPSERVGYIKEFVKYAYPGRNWQVVEGYEAAAYTQNELLVMRINRGGKWIWYIVIGTY